MTDEQKEIYRAAIAILTSSRFYEYSHGTPEEAMADGVHSAVSILDEVKRQVPSEAQRDQD